MRRLLITGGAGFIGTNLLHYWAAKYPQDYMVVLDQQEFSKVPHLHHLREKNCMYIQGDIKNTDFLSKVLKDQYLHTIIHCAGVTGRGESLKDPDYFFENNCQGTHSILKAAARYQAQGHAQVRLHFVSTGDVFGSLTPGQSPAMEVSAYNPDTPYGASMASAEHWVSAYGKTYDLPVTISHSADNMGPHQLITKLIPRAIYNVLRGQEIVIRGSGNQLRSWIFTEDHCRAIDTILYHGELGETYNIGGLGPIPTLDLLHQLFQILEGIFKEDSIFSKKFSASPLAQGQAATSLLRFVQDPHGTENTYVLNSHKALVEFGFKPSYDLEKSLYHTISWYLNQWLITN